MLHEDQHSVEPWALGILTDLEQVQHLAISAPGEPDPGRVDRPRCVGLISWLQSADAQDHANARRIVACVNALAGTPTEQLEKLAVGEVTERTDALRTACAAALEYITERPEGLTAEEVIVSTLQAVLAETAPAAETLPAPPPGPAPEDVLATVRRLLGDTPETRSCGPRSTEDVVRLHAKYGEAAEGLFEELVHAADRGIRQRGTLPYPDVLLVLSALVGNLAIGMQDAADCTHAEGPAAWSALQREARELAAEIRTGQPCLHRFALLSSILAFACGQRVAREWRELGWGEAEDVA